MFHVATTAQMKELDRIAIQEQGIPSLDLMEHAATAVAEAVKERVPMPAKKKRKSAAATFDAVVISAGEPSEEQRRQAQEIQAILDGKRADPTPRVAVFCGPGNNGGDGIAAARLLREAGYQVRCFLVGNRAKMTPDARAMEEKLRACGGTLEDFTFDAEHPSHQDSLLMTWCSTCDAMVDALFGVGLKRPVQGDFRTAVLIMNRYAAHCPVIACDVPSGLDGDSGAVLGIAVRAACTVTFTCPKPGFYLGEGEEHCGELRVAEIGIPEELVWQQVERGPAPVVALSAGEKLPLPRRPRNSHKGDYGRLFLLAGSEGYTGAPVLAARAALRTGAGLVFLGVPRSIYPIVAGKCEEAMPFPLPDSFEEILLKARGCDAALLGPGLGRAPEMEELVCRLLKELEIPVVLDADGINAVAGHIDVLDARSAPTILTPHDGEFQRLSGCALPIPDRLTAARDFAVSHGCYLVLKGHGTVVASPLGKAVLCCAGNPGMATGGSGDVLSGVLVSLLGQKPLREGRSWLMDRTVAGVWYHALAGDLCAREKGEYGMLPSDMIEALPRILMEQAE